MLLKERIIKNRAASLFHMKTRTSGYLGPPIHNIKKVATEQRPVFTLLLPEPWYNKKRTLIFLH